MDPVIDILLGISQNFALAGGTGRRVNSDNLGIGDCQQGKWIPHPKIVGRGEGQFANVIQRPNVLGTDPGLFQSLAVKGGSLAGMRHGPLQAL